MTISFRIAASVAAYFLFVLVVLSEVVSGQNLNGSAFCEFYNGTLCSESEKGCLQREECPLPAKGKRYSCYASWQFNSVTNTSIIKMSGCWADNQVCDNEAECVDSMPSRKRQIYFCCCYGDMCNRNYSWAAPPTNSTTVNNGNSSVITVSQNDDDEPSELTLEILLLSSSLLILVTVLLLFCLYYKCKQLGSYNKAQQLDSIPQSKPSSNLDLDLIKLMDIKARGKFGTVWKAELKTELVAVKVFSNKDKQSWQSEQEIFNLVHTDQDNILHFIGSGKKGDDLQAEFWLVTAYHENGSLCDYLKTNVVTWADMCKIAESMARGLMHLHEEIPADKVNGHKPAVAHRDFKSKNVLLKSGMRACIADFGLSLVFHPDKPCGDTHGQVGIFYYRHFTLMRESVIRCIFLGSKNSNDTKIYTETVLVSVILLGHHYEFLSRRVATGGFIFES